MKPRKRFVLFNDMKDDVPQEEWKECLRTSGEMPCECGEKLKEHYQPIQLTCPTIVEDCQGRWWKL